MRKRLVWIVGGMGGFIAANIIRRWVKRSTQPQDAPTAQVLQDAGIALEPGLFGPRVKLLDPLPAQSQPQSAVAQSVIDPLTFPETRDGHGVYGQWKIDADQLPSYLYELDHRSSRLAFFINSQGLDRRDHWHQIGNDHITALACNDGVVQVYLADRGGIFLNRYAPQADDPRTLMGYFTLFVDRVILFIGRVRAAYYRWRLRDKIIPRGINPMAPAAQETLDPETEFAYSGGYSYLNDGQETWATAQRYAPSGAKTRRVFGLGYFETETVHRGIRHTRRVYAPYGDHPTLITDIEIQNTGSSAVTLRCYEYWDVNVHQMRVQWVRSGVFASSGDFERTLLNSRFQPQIHVELEGQSLRFRQQRYEDPPFTAEELAGFVDSNPPEVFLTNLSGPDAPAVDYYIDKATFFGSGDAFQPETVRANHPGKADHVKTSESMPYCLVLRHDLYLAPGETQTLRFAYGALVRPEQSLAFLNEYSHHRHPFKQTIESWKQQLLYFSNGQSAILPWEASWHAYNLLSSTLYSEFYQTHYIPQGSAYLYLHGADGAPRDQALFTLPLVYIRPALARDLLILLMRMRRTDTQSLPYSFVGNGAQDNALGLHSRPSDLDLFFLLAMAEYMAATGDRAFLQERYPLYKPGSPPTPGPELTVLEHIGMAFTHLETSIGLGSHNLLVIGSGDWDDSIVAARSFNPTFDRERTMREGESVPNSQMAVYVLALIAAQIESHDASLSERMRSMTSTLKTALYRQWNSEKKWFYRAWMWDRLKGNDPVGNNSLSLQAQIWPLISGLAQEMGIEAELIQTITQQLDDDSPTGAMLEPAGQIWPAVSQLLTWGYQRSRPDLAWRSLNRHTFAVHANVYPSIWFNIWTGPDGTNSHSMPNPGGTWASPVTPMTDLPGMNANQDAMALLGLLRVCGIEPSKTGNGLIIAPKAPVDRYVLKTELLSLDVAPGRIAGEYQAANNGSVVLHIALPEQAFNIVARVNENITNHPLEGGYVRLPLQFVKGQRLTFDVVWK